MAEPSYFLPRALDDLSQADLLQGILLPQDGCLMPMDQATLEAKCPDECFLGAGLDSRALSDKALFVALKGEHVDGRTFVVSALEEGHWVLTRSLAVAEHDPLLGATVSRNKGVLLSRDPEKALACLAASWRRQLAVEVVAITGTNGKTTTKDLIAAMLSGAGKTQATRGNLNNHLGLPLTLLNLVSATRYAVVEMGASALGEIDFLARLTLPDVGVITNASAAHLAEFGSLENIIQGKGELLDVLPDNGVAILNRDSQGFEQWQERAACLVVSWGETQGENLWEYRDSQLILAGQSWSVPLPGRHNAANLCAAVLACRALKVPDPVLREGLQNFQGSEHRGCLLHWLERTILDDSYNANPTSMLAAVKVLTELAGPGKNIAVLGAMAELGEHSDDIHRQTGITLAGENLHHLLVVGPGANPLADGFGMPDKVTKVRNHQEAAEWLVFHTGPGDRILIKGSRSSAMEKILARLSEDKNSSIDEMED